MGWWARFGAINKTNEIITKESIELEFLRVIIYVIEFKTEAKTLIEIKCWWLESREMIVEEVVIDVKEIMEVNR